MTCEYFQMFDVSCASVENTKECEEFLKDNTVDILLLDINHITLVCDFWKEPEELENEIMLEGRLPKYDNEIVITTSVSERLQAEVGDVVYVEGRGEAKDYIVSGIEQKLNNMGIRAMMNFEGAERLNGQSHVYSLYVLRYLWCAWSLCC